MNTLWYPYSQMKTELEHYKVTSAEGVYLHLEDGRKLIDSISSWWCVIHGYNHPEINQAAKEQLEKMSHVMLGGLTHDPVEKLAKKLVQITPKGLNHVFFSDSGSVGVEVAMKMAVQYWRNLGQKEKYKLLSLKKAYHGDTSGVMSIGDPDDGMHALFSGILPKQLFLDAPQIGYEADENILINDLVRLENTLKTHNKELAAFIVEPIIQAAGGFNFYSPRYLEEAKLICDKYSVLLIFDEVATGFGRTGTMFAADQTKITPDIMILGKALTAGYLGHAATLATTEIFNAFYDDDPAKAFMHGPTFMGNPLACSIALKGIEIFEKEDYLSKISEIEKTLKTGMLQIKSQNIKDIRVLGATGVIEVKDKKSLEGIQEFAANRGVWLRPFEKYLYTMPPYIISEIEINQIIQVMKDWFRQ
jgi:adenosylmethionine---8-amino-7-oxononanoate aminotransferase